MRPSNALVRGLPGRRPGRGVFSARALYGRPAYHPPVYEADIVVFAGFGEGVLPCAARRNARGEYATQAYYGHRGEYVRYMVPVDPSDCLARLYYDVIRAEQVFHLAHALGKLHH